MSRTVRIKFRSRQSQFLRSPYSIFFFAIFFTIVVATGLLLLPISSKADSSATFLEALFTSTSAVTVTGLVVVDTAEQWSFFGQLVIFVLIFLGGLGFITFVGFIISVIRQRIGLQGRLALSGESGTEIVGNLASNVRKIVVVATLIQLVAFVLIFTDFVFISKTWADYSLLEVTWQALFHAVSSFNNAGIDIIPSAVSTNSLSGIATSYLTITVTTIAIVLGGLSFPVMFEIIYSRRFRLFSIDTKLVLIGTVSLVVIGALVVGFSEWSNSSTLGSKPVAAKLLGSVLESVTTRSAGFTTIDQSETSILTTAVSIILMLIGGAALTTAGGIKVNVFMLFLINSLSIFKKHRVLTVFNRTIPQEIVSRAFLIISFVLGLLVLVNLALIVAQPLDVSRGVTVNALVFEATSAVGTVGLSKGVTPNLNGFAQLVLVIAMLLGRFGPIIIALVHTNKRPTGAFKYPTEQVRIG